MNGYVYFEYLYFKISVKRLLANKNIQRIKGNIMKNKEIILKTVVTIIFKAKNVAL